MRSRVEIALDALKTCSDHYANSFARFAGLDAKAQGTAATAGVLLGASLAFLPQPIFRATLGAYPIGTTVSVEAVVVLAVAAITLAMLAVRVKTVRTPFRGDLVSAMALDLLALHDDELTEAVVQRHYSEQLAMWPPVITDIAKSVRTKAHFVMAAQSCLLVSGVILAGFLSIVLSTVY